MRSMVLRSFALCMAVLLLLTCVPAAYGLSISPYTINSLAEYETELAKYEIPGDYVTYDMIKSVGKFVKFFSSFAQKPSEDVITFWLEDATGTSFFLRANRKSGAQSTIERPQAKPADIHDLRTLQGVEAEKYCRYTLGAITYDYDNGILTAISWEHRERKYKLDVGLAETMENYPKDADTFLAHLLDVDNAEAAVRELMDTVDAAQKPQRQKAFWRSFLEWSLVVGGVLLIAAVWIFAVKAKEKKRLLEEIEEEEFKEAHKDA